MVADGFALDGFEGTSTDMQGDFATGDAALIYGLQDFGSKVQTSSGSSYRPLDFRIDGLIGAEVAGFGVAVEIGGNGQFAYGIQYLRKRNIVVPPFEGDDVPCVVGFAACGAQLDHSTRHLDFFHQGAFFPLLQITHHTDPATRTGLCKGLCIVGRRVWFQTEDFDICPCTLLKVQAGIDHLRVVEDHQCALGEQVGQ